MSAVRLTLGAVGTLLAGYGGWLLISRGGDLVNVLLWLAGGVVLHDVVLSLAVLVVGAVVLPVLPRAARAPAAVGSVVLGSVTLLAVPVLGRFGARPDNPTLLDRNYALGWLVLAGVTIVAVATATFLGSRRR